MRSTARLADRRLDAQFLALMLTLPSEQDIAGEMARNVDPDLVHRAATACAADLGRLLAPRAHAVLEMASS